MIESHPDNIHEDLRLDHTFPGLAQFCDSLDLDEMNFKVKASKLIAFLALTPLHILNIWKNMLPKTGIPKSEIDL